MSDFQTRDQLLDATIQYLEGLQARGVRYVSLSRLEPAEPVASPEASRETATDPARSPEPSPSESSSMPEAPPLPSVEATPAAKEAAMVELRERALVCTKCPHLAKSRRNVVFGVGDIHSQLLFVGEAPGMDEDREGEPFVGRAGQLLTRIIQTMGLSRETVYIANILKCRPDTPGRSYGNRKPTPEEMQTCIPYLQAQIDIIQPKVMVALGATAAEGLLGKSGYISQMRGQWQEYRGIPLMPTYHPSFVLRKQTHAIKRQIWEDMLLVMERLELPISDKQRAYFT